MFSDVFVQALDKKIPPNATISPDGKHYYIKDGKNGLSCFKITYGKKDEKLWSKTFGSNIKDFDFDPKDMDRIDVITNKRTWRGDILKENFSYN